MEHYDFTYLSFGAGVQSSTIAEMIVEGFLPTINLAIFADTQDEPEWVYKQLEYIKERLSSIHIPLISITVGNIYDDLVSGKGRFAAIPVFTVNKLGRVGKLRRQCTREYKIDPIEKIVKKELLSRGLAKQNKIGSIYINKGVKVNAIIGISLDEFQRMKPNRRKWISNSWPLIEKRMRRIDCINWLQANNLPTPKKSSCLICPFHNNSYWRDLKNNYPNYWSFVTEFDSSLRNSSSRFSASAHGHLFLHQQIKPLVDVDLSTPQEHGQMEMWDVCDSGYCFI
jgi:hypothetical protein